MEQYAARRKGLRANTWTGILFLLIGGVLLMRQSGYPLPSWLFGWEMIVITVGVFIGIRNGFRDFSWLILILIGVIFLSDDIWPAFKLKQYAVPVIIISLGLLFLLAPKGMCRGRGTTRRNSMPPGAVASVQHPTATDFDNTDDSTLDIVSIFSGVKKRVLSKQFSGGDIVCIFGGAEVSLANADFNSQAVLELVQIFGGTKLVVPSNWEVRSEVAAIFGGIDDKRPNPTVAVPEKTVILKGTIIFGGVEVNSY